MITRGGSGPIVPSRDPIHAGHPHVHRHDDDGGYVVRARLPLGSSA